MIIDYWSSLTLAMSSENKHRMAHRRMDDHPLKFPKSTVNPLNFPTPIQ